MAAPKNNLDQDLSTALQQQVQDALAKRTPLNICGSGSKHFLGRSTQGERLSLSEHRGIIEYDPR